MGFDAVVIFVLIFSFIYGFIRGFFRQILSLAGLILAAYFAMFHYHRAHVFLSQYIKGGGLLLLSSIALTFIIVYLAFAIVSFFISFIIKGFIGFFDRLIGAIFAVFKTLVLLSVIALFLASFETSKSWVFSSKIGPHLYSSGVFLASQVEKVWREKWKSGLNLKK